MALVLGIDAASTTGFCFGDSACERPIFWSKKFTREFEAGSMEGAIKASSRALETMIDFTQAEKLDMVAIEAPVPERALAGKTNTWSTVIKFMLLGAFGNVCEMRSIPLRLVNIQKVRSHFLGPGNGNLKGDFAKSEVMRFCRAAGWEPATKDESDAGAVWHFASTLIDPRNTRPIDPITLRILPVQKPLKGERVSKAPLRFRRSA